MHFDRTTAEWLLPFGFEAQVHGLMQLTGLALDPRDQW